MEQTWEVVDFRKFRPLLLILVVLVLLVIAVGSSIVNIGGDEAGIVEKKFGGGELPPGRILAVEGEALASVSNAYGAEEDGFSQRTGEIEVRAS